ncbi:MAG TPA: lipid A deacylase LpxR family protein [Gemmatimonadaceae bacterium]
MTPRRNVRSFVRVHRVGTLIVAATAVFAIPSVTRAQSEWRPKLELDNDVYNFWQRHTRRPDEEYTNGVHVLLESWTAPWWGRRLAPEVSDCASGTFASCRSTTLSLGQDLYTPHLDRTPHAVDGWQLERPYFAWLYLSASARVTSATALSATTMAVGVTGPPAGGAMAQRVAHRIGFNEPATGWQTQIGFEPGVLLGWRRAALLMRGGEPRGPGFDLAPEIATSLGNIRTSAGAGGTARIGWNLSHPWHPPAWKGRAAAEWWVTAGARAEYVARDMSLDGTLHRPTRRVDRVPGVTQYEFGAAVRARGVTLEYRAVTRSREYRTGPAHHTYSSMSIALTPP